MARRSRWIAAATAAVVVAVAALAWWPLRGEPGDEPVAAEEATSSTATRTIAADAVDPAPGPCDGPVAKPFTPERISIAGVVEDGPVVGVPRDDRGVTGVLPFSNKVEFAWDLGGIRPGSRRGNVLLNTHTWPDGSALGNALLDGLELGDRIIVSGADAQVCYRVDLRIEVPAEEGYPPYYATKGPPRVAIIVCSGRRTGPGQWSHRTIWFARQITQV